MKHCRFLIPMLAAILLSACAPMKDAINPYEENFRCRASDNEDECIDTTAAYKKARYPEIIGNKTGFNVSDIKQIAQKNRYKVLASLLEKEKKPLLQPPKILRVLLLPYEGENDELFMTRYVYLRIENSKWILTDLTAK